MRVKIISRVICKFDKDSDREIVIMDAERDWSSKNIAFFKSTGSNPKFSMFANTFFPMLGCYVNEETTPIQTLIGDGVQLSTNYIIKLGGTFPTLFRGDTRHTIIPEWINDMISDYIPSSIDISTITSLDQLDKLKQRYAKVFLLYECLTYYFSSERQVYLSIALSKKFNCGIWINELSDFAEYLPEYKITHIQQEGDIHESQLYHYLYANNAQYISISGVDFVQMPYSIYEALYRNEQRVDQQIRTLSRLTSRTPIQSMTPKIVEETPRRRSTRRRSPSPRMSPSTRRSPSSRRSRRRSPHL